MLQLVVSLNETHVFSFEACPTVLEISRRLQEAEGIPAGLIALSRDGVLLQETERVTADDQFLRAIVAVGICGGKGGFGAQLRALAKQKAYRKTVDFGACRDLNGRRLRHVNDEILLQKWKEAKDKGETLETDGQTPTGIDLWYLAAPSWAEGVKVDKRKLFMKPRMKTEMCIDWKRARERRPAPEGAPAHWGCPRGRRCEFAHGIEELRGEAQTALKDAELNKKREEQHQKHEQYMGVIHRATKQEDELEDLVLAGLRAAKKAKLAAQGQAPVASEQAGEGALEQGDEPPDGGEVAEEAETAEETQEQVDYLSVVAGTVVVTKESVPTGLQTAVCPVITGTSAFATVAADKCTLTAGSGKTWYYEVELQSDGLMQIGWCTSAFLATARMQQTVDAVEKDGAASADGVWDDVDSWAFDGYRQQKWHNGEGAAYGPQTGVIWKAGDVVGCRLHLHASKTGAVHAETTSKKRKKAEQTETSDAAGRSRATISYSLNGEDYGTAFEFDVPPTVSGSPEQFFPAVSLENDEAALLNLGNRAFKFSPTATSSSSSEEKHSGEVSAVWSSVVGAEVLATNEAVADGGAVHLAHIRGTHDGPPGAGADATSAAPVARPSEPADYPEIDLASEEYASADALEALGLGHLKAELERRGMKAGGTQQERAQRLFSARGLRLDQIDPKLLVKKK
jgi:hypothetical protein